MMINISKEDTYKLLWLETKILSNKKRYKFKTLHKWWCLNCRKEIFIGYDISNVVNIFCDNEECQEHKKHPTILHYQYIRKLKEDQLKMFNNI